MDVENPFVVKGYAKRELFCDRENELAELAANAKNKIDTTLLADRRMGKTGLIFRFFESVDENKMTPIYVDIFSSRSVEDLVKLLAEAVLAKYPERSGFGKRFLNFIKSFRPIITYDPVSGSPQVQISYQSKAEREWTLKSILDFLEHQKKPVILAIDEFQQISEYPEKNIEALLRTFTQQLKNIRFIFCGSKTSLIADMFSNVKRPFFHSTKFLNLEKIDSKKYSQFIKKLFNRHKKLIDDDAIDFILNWTLGHTFYTQYVCNQAFANSRNNVHLELVKRCCVNILQENESVFLQYRQMLTSLQWNFLIAIAKEGRVKHITAQDFLLRHKIGNPANAKRQITSLTEKELLLAKTSTDGTFYSIYDVFFSHWLKSTY